MTYKNLLTKKSDGIGWITINRPDKLNAMNVETIGELKAAFAEFETDADVRAVILTGSGEKAFVAGADISEFVQLNAEMGRQFSRQGQVLTRSIEHFPKPVIAAINGFALGGGTEIALACHIRLASENAKLGQPEVKLGIIPGYGGTQRLARLVGKGKALEMILTGRMIEAKEAAEIGLVNKVVPAADLLSAAEAFAREAIKNGPLAIASSIEAINRGLDGTLDEGLELEAEIFGRTCATEDFKEGAKAFLEKRKPDFRGR
ncbi:MAG: 3-hydroxybutyryl-CoA dehydratase [Candidatus Aminicenantes bacterium]|jgi:enoyl-CoA hydratase|nr:3-hydroxybutyryl-CoA dehydratase [Candidatus Aminicenantes bacterium]